ncbi:hypothetical protein DM02DRAFT_657820 [Periconia macrospinosa]|uniref:BZIP domain-containing protein n=1 Tax=Periconia macrospinosa TaxID=97972 RepID=A0A2V1DKZ7_9PLEO|nr:hypothetical protein DM02DRAFT_657820 [Periconia macrospinosa]
MASTSPETITSPASASNSRPALPEHENLERKRARDRKSQKAMRERTKWNIQSLTHQVEQLTQALSIETREKNELYNRFLAVSEENEHLRVQKAALQLRLLGNGHTPPDSASSPNPLPPYETIPLNVAPTCMSDQILQTFVESRWEAHAMQSAGRIPTYPDVPDLTALLDGRPNRVVDETSSVVGDIVRSYSEIDTLPKQVAVLYIMYSLMKWQVLRTKAAYEAVPEWLRPEPIQLKQPHASWIDRIPWPKLRVYLITHPEIKFDEFVAAYSSSFTIDWQYDPKHVIIITNNNDKDSIVINPVYEEHLKQLKNWTVQGIFRRKFPEMAEIVDNHAKSEKTVGSVENMLNPLPLPHYAI